MTDRDMSLERHKARLGKNLCDEAHLLMRTNRPSIRDRDPCALLAPMLQGIKAEECQTRNVLVWSIDPKYSTFLVRMVTPHRCILPVEPLHGIIPDCSTPYDSRSNAPFHPNTTYGVSRPY